VKQTLKNKPVIDPKEIFGHNPANYDHARVGYKPEFIKQMLFTMMPDLDQRIASGASPLSVVDIGAGTGKLGEQFLNYGCHVTFVEPNPHSAAYIAQIHGSRPDVKIINKPAESTELPDKHADIIVMGDAAHWIEPSTLPELRRILKPEGKIAMFARFWSQESPLTEKVHDLLLKECPEYHTSSTQLLRNMGNLKRRLGRHLVSEEENFWHGYSFVKPYPKEDLMDYFRSCSFSAPAIERDEASFRKNVIEPLWEFAQSNGLIDDKNQMKVPYEINAMYGSPRLRVSVDAGKNTGRS
jgi:SAM-dependent methyltransferase